MNNFKYPIKFRYQWACVVTDSKLGFGPGSEGSKQPFAGLAGESPSRLIIKMEHPIVEKILKDGISSVNLSMLDESARKKILSDVGEKLYRQNKFIEAIEIMAKAGDIGKLIRIGDLFLSENKIELAAFCFIPTKDKSRLNEAAVSLIKSKNYRLAAKAYEAADNRQMASFIQQNFVEDK